MQASGQLLVYAGRIGSVQPRAGKAHVIWQPRGTPARVADDFDRIINCTGPAVIERDASDTLLGSLIAAGIAVADPLGLGLEVDQQSRVIGADGRARDDLFALGALTRGKFWEIGAVPDIRVQAWSLARRLSNAHWVGGEGL